MIYSDLLSQYYNEKLSGSYDCVDRIVLNGYVSSIQFPGGFRFWYRKLNQNSDKDLDNSRLMKMAGRFSRRVYAWANSRHIPVLQMASGERKHLVADDYIPKDPHFEGIFLIMATRASANIYEVDKFSSGAINIKRKIAFVRHFFFHIMDKSWGHITFRICAHPPFNCMVILNGHEWAERKLTRKDISFEKSGNCFVTYADGEALTRVADTCSKGQPGKVCDRWIYSILWFALDYQQQEQAPLKYSYSVYQVEYSRNLNFCNGAWMNDVYQNIINLTRASLDVKRIKTMFGRKNRPHYRRNAASALQGCIEIPDYNLTVFKIHFGALTLKLYDKGEHTLRAEVVVHNTKDLKCKRSLDNFEIIVHKLKAMMNTFLDNLLYAHVSLIGHGELERLTTTQTAGKIKSAGINYFKKKDKHILHSVMALAFKPGGFNISDVVTKVLSMYGQKMKPTQAAYIIKKLRAKKIIEMPHGKRKYWVNKDGIQMIVGMIAIVEQQLPQVLALSKNPDLSIPMKNRNQYHDAMIDLKRAIRNLSALSHVKIAA